MMHEAPVPSEGEKSSNRAIILWESASGAVSHGVDFLVHSVGIITVESTNAPYGGRPWESTAHPER